MIHVEIRPNLEHNPWDDLAGLEPGHGQIERIGLLPNGTENGRPTVALVIRLDDGQLVVAETTWALWGAATIAFNGSPVAERDRMENP